MALSLSFCIWKNHVILIVWSPLKRDAFKQSQYFESARTNYLVYEHSGTEDGNSTGFSSGYQVDSPIDTTELIMQSVVYRRDFDRLLRFFLALFWAH